MSKIWALTKVLLKTNLFVGSTDDKKKKSKVLGGALIVLLFVFVIASVGVPIALVISNILEAIDIRKIILGLILPLAGLTTIIFSIFSVVSVFYLSKDSEYLLPLPIEPRDLMISKFLVSLVTEYYILFMFVLPCLIGVGIGIDAGVLYYVYMLIVFLLLPIIPSVVVTFVILIITRFTGVMKNKDLFMYVSMILILAFSFGYNEILGSAMEINMDNIGGTVANLESELLPYFRRLFPFYNSGVSALVNYNDLGGVFSLITFIGINLIALLFIYFLGDKLYLKTLTVVKGSNKKKTDFDKLKISDNRGCFGYLLMKEWLTVKRTPVFMLNIVLIVVLFPFIMLFSFIMGYSSSGEEESMLNLAFLNNQYDNVYVFFIALASLTFFTCSSMAASTSISREGSNAWFMKVIPVSAFKQINAKVLFACILDVIGILIVAIMAYVLKMDIGAIISLLIPVILVIILSNYFNIYIDLRRPKIKWADENAAVKSNLNGFFSMLVTLAECGFFGVVAFVCYKVGVTLNYWIVSLIVSAVLVVLLGIVVYLFKRNENKLLDKVD